MEKDKISIIVPGYQVEKYLGNCLDSLINQTYQNIEIITIDDGSTDNTKKIMEDYQKKHPDKIKAFSQNNQGLSYVRNRGLELTTGEYVMFVDGDDTLQIDTLEQMHNKAISKDFDIVSCDILYVFKDKSKNYIVSSNYQEDLLTKEEIKKTFIDFFPSVCNKLYKSTLLKNHQFKSGIYFEDVEFLYRLYPKINSIGIIKEPFYEYLQREGSITHVYDEKCYHYIENMNGIVKYYKENGYYEEYKKELEYSYIRYIYATFIRNAAIGEDKTNYKKAVELAIKNVKENFPKHWKNKYFYKSGKGLYLLLFNKTISKLIYSKFHKIDNY